MINCKLSKFYYQIFHHHSFMLHSSYGSNTHKSSINLKHEYLSVADFTIREFELQCTLNGKSFVHFVHYVATANFYIKNYSGT